MNFRVLYALYFTLVISVIFTICATVINEDVRESFRDGVNDGMASADADHLNKQHFGLWRGYMILNNFRVQPSSTKVFGELSEDSFQVTVNVKALDVSVRNYSALPKQFKCFYILEMVLSVIVSILIIYLIVLLYKLFRRMQKSLKERVVFSMGVVRVLKSLGIMLILIEILSTAFYYFHNKAAQIVLEPYGYQVDSFIEIEYTTIILGIGLLLVSEFMKIGYKIQEEQSLTV